MPVGTRPLHFRPKPGGCEQTCYPLPEDRAAAIKSILDAGGAILDRLPPHPSVHDRSYWID